MPPLVCLFCPMSLLFLTSFHLYETHSWFPWHHFSANNSCFSKNSSHCSIGCRSWWGQSLTVGNNNIPSRAHALNLNQWQIYWQLMNWLDLISVFLDISDIYVYYACTAYSTLHWTVNVNGRCGKMLLFRFCSHLAPVLAASLCLAVITSSTTNATGLYCMLFLVRSLFLLWHQDFEFEPCNMCDVFIVIIITEFQVLLLHQEHRCTTVL